MKKINIILSELKNHSPFTLFGAFTGIICMLAFKNLQEQTSERIFYIFHPAHVLLSAIVTTSMFKLHTSKKRLIAIFLVGFFGSIGISTLSDSIIPYVGELLLGMKVHIHEHSGFAEHAHIGFIEAWYLVLPAAIIGIVIAYIKPKTKVPHAGHVLLSTWASSFHIIMAMGGHLSLWEAIVSFGFLFVAVLLPCCFSDIVFPLLFVKPAPSAGSGQALSEIEGSEGNPSHAHHH